MIAQDPKTIIGANVKAARELGELTQLEVAHRCRKLAKREGRPEKGWQQTTISGIELGHRGTSTESQQILAEALRTKRTPTVTVAQLNKGV